MRTSSPACPDPERSEPQSFSPKSATAAADSPPPRHWHAWPASPPPPANRAPCVRSDSDGRATNTCATPSPTSPPTPAAPTPGPKTSTAALAPAATTTPTPCASWPAPGSTSSGTAGSTASATTRLNTAPSKHSCTTNNPPLDTGLLITALCSCVASHLGRDIEVPTELVEVSGRILRVGQDLAQPSIRLAAPPLWRVAHRHLREPHAVVPSGPRNVQVPVHRAQRVVAGVPLLRGGGAAPQRELRVEHGVARFAHQGEVVHQDRRRQPVEVLE